MSQFGFRESLRRAGMRIQGGNLVEAPWSAVSDARTVGNIAWASRDTGLFVVDWDASKHVELEALAERDVIVCSAVLDQKEVQTDFMIGDKRFGAIRADMMTVFVPRHERFRFATHVSRDLKAVTIVANVTSLIDALGSRADTLPKSLQRAIRHREVAMETHALGHFGAIAREVIAQRAMFPPLASLYYQSKAGELVSALLGELARRDNILSGEGAFQPDIIERLDLVKQIIDDAPGRTLDVDDLARSAAMNRTKLRSAFKQVYGTTLSGYRTALLLQRAERALKQAGGTVKQAARHAGYATTSSFIVAYKKHYGVRPGKAARETLRC